MIPTLIAISGLVVLYTWYKYFLSINVFNPKKRIDLIVYSFITGGVAALIVLIINDFAINIYWLNAIIEESVKVICFIIFYNFFKSNFKNPLDYILYICFICLGFSLFENAIKIINEPDYNFYIIKRSILGPLGHMISSSLIIYGFVKFKYSKENL